jgi:predicted kinase
MMIVGGNIGTGKSTLAREIKRQTGYVLLQSDRIRKKLAGVPLFKKAPQKFYAPAFTQKTYKRLLEQAEAFASKGKGVILDATWGTKKYRSWLMKMVKKNDLDYWFIEAIAPEKEIIRRLKTRRRDISDADAVVFRRLSPRYEPPDEIPWGRRYRILN